MARILLRILLGVGATLLTLTAMGAIAGMTHPSPCVGDIIAFTPSGAQPVADATRLIVHRPEQYGCMLDLGIMRQSGGSLVVESEIIGAAGSFRVHWAGARTGAGIADCGNDADLILDRRELDTLALHVGGYGAGTKRTPVMLSANGL